LQYFTTKNERQLRLISPDLSALSRSDAGMVRIGVSCLAGPHLQGAQTNLPISSKESARHACICSSKRHTFLAGSRVPPLHAFVTIAFLRFSQNHPQNCCDTGDLRRRRPSDLTRHLREFRAEPGKHLPRRQNGKFGRDERER
jgi:hypothetical protein